RGGSTWGLVAGSIQKVRDSELPRPIVEVCVVERAALEGDHAQNVAPLLFGGASTIPKPQQLSKNRILGRLEVESGIPGFDAHGDAAPEFLTIERAVAEHEEIELEQSVDVDGIERSAIAAMTSSASSG